MAMNAYEDLKEGVTGKKTGFLESLFVGMGTYYALNESEKQPQPVSQTADEPETPHVDVPYVPSRPVAVSSNPAGKHIKDFLK